MNRGMDFNRMVDLVSENGPILTFKREVEAYFEELEKRYTAKVDEVYKGNAAEMFKEKLAETSIKLNKLLDDILRECVNKVNIKDEEYTSQEIKMQNSME